MTVLAAGTVLPFDPRPAGARELSALTDDELMRLARTDHRAAFAQLVARHADAVTQFCIKMLGDRRTGEDVAQDTWLAVWTGRARYQPQGKFTALLYTVARNRCRNAWRGRARRGTAVALDPDRSATSPLAEPTAVSATPSASDAPLDALLAAERAERVTRALAELKPKLREAVLLRYSLGLDYEQIATVVRRSESTVRSRVFHGLKKLRAQLGEVQV